MDQDGQQLTNHFLESCQQLIDWPTSSAVIRKLMLAIGCLLDSKKASSTQGKLLKRFTTGLFPDKEFRFTDIN